MLSYIAKYFTLNRRERNAILALITCLFALVITKFVVVYHYQSSAQTVMVVDLDSTAARLATQDLLFPGNNDSKETSFASKRKKDSLFYFDPNVISFAQAVQLGFEAKCAHQLVNYRDKGGKFYKPGDLEKLYCMDKVLYSRLEKYIIIENSKENSKETSSTKKEKQVEAISIEINSADSNEWIKLRGIGPGYARRILKYRTMLGGFTSIDQIKEVYNFPDSVYQSIKGNLTVNAALVQKLKVNAVDFKTMVHHPYIKYEGTKCIFALKRDKKIKQEDLVNSSCFSRESLQKVLPYLDFE